MDYILENKTVFHSGPKRDQSKAKDATDANHVSVQQRCRDYDEKGFCVRGDLCPYDHGTDPVVVDEMGLPGVLRFSSSSSDISQSTVASVIVSSELMLPDVNLPPPPLPFQAPPPNYSIPPHMGFPNTSVGTVPYGTAVPPMSAAFRPPHIQHAHPGVPSLHVEPYMPEPYRPSVIGYRERVGNEWQPRLPDNSQPSRQLVHVQTTSQDNLDKDESHATTVEKNSRSNDRDGTVVTKKSFNSSGFNTTLELRKIPRQMNTICKINEHFSRFGTLVNLQVGYDGDPEAAIVSFASHAQARAAYRSVEPLFNNRFIKIFWHHPERKPQPPQSTSEGASGKSIVSSSSTSLSKENQVDNKQVSSTTSKAGVKRSYSGTSGPPVIAAPGTTKLQRKPTKEQLKKDALKKKLELQKQSQLLLQKQIEQQKLLIEKLEKNKNMSAEDRATVIKTIKKLASDIDQLKVKLTVSSAAAPQPEKRRRLSSGSNLSSFKKVNVINNASSSSSVQQHSKQLSKKALLDTELDLMAVGKDGSTDTSELRKKVAALKQEAISLGLLNTAGHITNSSVKRGDQRKWTAPSLKVSRSVDRRPREVSINGLSADDVEDVTKLLTGIGEIECSQYDNDNLLITFKTHPAASKLVSDGLLYKGHQLAVSWSKATATTATDDIVVVDESNEDEPLRQLSESDSVTYSSVLEDDDVDEKALLGLDEEDDDEDREGRSWRR